MMSAPQVEEALHTLRGCLTYDPQKRWLPSYRVLEETLGEINRAHRPVAALHVAATVGAISVILLNVTRSVSSEFWIYATAALFFVPSLATLLMRLFIVRRFPLVRRHAEIEAAIKPFRAMAPSATEAVKT